MHSSLFITLGLGPIFALATVGPFFNYCGSNSLDYSTLESSCSDGHTSIDLDSGIINNNGELVFSSGGGYFGSCAKNGGNCDLSDSYLQCACLNDAGDNVNTHIDLNLALLYDDVNNVLSWNF